MDIYNLSTIEKVDIRLLSDDELSKVVPDNAKNLTPVYFVIQGKDKNQNEITVFVNSNDKKINYSNR
ncbi:hypothetical protein [Neobacillus sp. YIM B06451]|uniref:hypothetical protein n=1 Tax=Neobacillus sp. YIM B06451 TaxID=3070994 RepID=UPI00292F4F92|nr:hypothetical protein [Neobacillus sp. YIM B06451]